MIHTTVVSPREAIQLAFGAVGDSFPSLGLNDKIAEIALVVDILGHGDRVTTGQIKRQLRQTGRA